MKQIKHWQDAANALLGIGLIVSPWGVGYSADSVATATALLSGIALVAAALGAIFVPRAWEEWTEAALGLWLMMSPWILGFRAHADARNTIAGIGIVVAALALWTLATDKDYTAWRHGGTVH
ncbi:MAG: SPW repeat protein [Caldimonas sp.]